MTAARHVLLCIGAVAAAVFLTLAPRSAEAHASLLSAVPGEGVTIIEPPKTFRLDFNEPVSPLVMRLIRPDGSVAPLTSVTAANNSVTIAAPDMPQQGSYALSWRVISADGHPVGGVVSFALGHPSGAVTAPPVEGATAVYAAIWLMQFVVAIGLFIGAGGAVFAAWIAGKRPMAAHRLVAKAMVGGVIAALVSLACQGLDALALPLQEAWRPSIWLAGFATSWGTSVILTLLTLSCGLIVLLIENERLARWLAIAVLAGIGFVYVASGHATGAEPVLTLPAIFLHAVCIALWVGALLPLTLAVQKGDRIALERFSRMIPIPLLVLIASGILLTIIGFDRLDAFWTTAYGEILAVKLTIVLALLALGALNRYRLVPRLSLTGAGRLVTVIATEFVLAVVILGIVGLWRFTPPPRALAAAETTYIHFHGVPAMAQIDLTPVRDRGALVSIAITDDNSNPIPVKEVALDIWNPNAGIEPIRRKATFTGGSDWQIKGLRIPVAGVWRMRVEILISDFDKLMLEDNVELPRAP